MGRSATPGFCQPPRRVREGSFPAPGRAGSTGRSVRRCGRRRLRTGGRASAALDLDDGRRGVFRGRQDLPRGGARGAPGDDAEGQRDRPAVADGPQQRDRVGDRRRELAAPRRRHRAGAGGDRPDGLPGRRRGGDLGEAVGEERVVGIAQHVPGLLSSPPARSSMNTRERALSASRSSTNLLQGKGPVRLRAQGPPGPRAQSGPRPPPAVIKSLGFPRRSCVEPTTWPTWPWPGAVSTARAAGPECSLHGAQIPTETNQKSPTPAAHCCQKTTARRPAETVSLPACRRVADNGRGRPAGAGGPWPGTASLGLFGLGSALGSGVEVVSLPGEEAGKGREPAVHDLGLGGQGLEGSDPGGDGDGGCRRLG